MTEILDTKTTGLSPENDKIVEIACVCGNLRFNPNQANLS